MLLNRRLLIALTVVLCLTTAAFGQGDPPPSSVASDDAPDRLAQALAELQAGQAQLIRQIGILTERIAELEARVAELEKVRAPAPRSGLVPSTDRRPALAGPPSRRHAVIITGVTSPRVLREAEALGAERCFIVYQTDMDPRREGRVDTERLRQKIERAIPSDFTGWATLDLENPYFAWIDEGEGPRFEQAQREMLRALAFAKRLRPGAKWSLYGMPRLKASLNDGKATRYAWHEAPKNLRARALGIAAAPAALFEALDWINPSIYDLYSNERYPGWHRDSQHALSRAKILLARSIADGRPVIACVWHRIHGGQPKDKLKLVPTPEWAEDQILLALDAGADGVAWWGADRWDWRTGALRSNNPDEFAGMDNESVERYFDGLHAGLARFLIQTVHAYRRD